MKFKLNFDMGNAAFAPEPQSEIARILTNIENAVVHGECYGTVMDFNGNRVGTWEIAD